MSAADGGVMCVKSGDLLSLFSNQAESVGYLSSEGFATKHCNVQPLSSASDVPRDFRNCVFRIQGAQGGANNSLTGVTLRYGSTVQLFHPASCNYVTVRRKEKAEVEHGCVKILLEREPNKSSYFKLLPRYKLRSEGEVVRYGEQVLLLSMKVSQYLHCSDLSRPRSSILEVNASSQPTGWRLTPFAQSTPESDEVLSGSDVVRFFHIEADAYLTVQQEDDEGGGNDDGVDDDDDDSSNHNGTLSDDDDEASLEQGLRGAKKNRRQFMGGRACLNVTNNLKEKQSALTLWLVEFENANRGGTMSWGDLCRFRHLGSGCYLTMNGDGVPCLAERQSSRKYNITNTNFPVSPRASPPTVKKSVSVNTPPLKGQFVKSHGSLAVPGLEVPGGTSNGIGSRSTSETVMSTATRNARTSSRHASVPPLSRSGSSSSSSEKDPTLFFLFPVNDDGKLIPYAGYTRIQHLQTETWFHTTETFLDKSDQSVQNTGMLLFGGTRAHRKRELRAEKSIYDEDVFTILPVEEDEVHCLKTVLSYTAVLSDYAGRVRAAGPIREKESDEVLRVIKFLQDFCVDKELTTVNIKTRQKFLRELKTLDIASDMIKAHLTHRITLADIKKPANKYAFQVIKQTNNFIKCAVMGNHKNGLYMAQHIDFMQSQLGYGTDTSHALMEMFTNNRSLLDKITDKQINFFVEIMKARGKLARGYVNFLAVLCTYDECALPINQNIICKSLLEDNGHLLKQNRVVDSIGPDGRTERVVEVNHDDEWVSLKHFMSTQGEQETECFQLTLAMLARLCAGRNFNTIQHVSAYCSYEHVLLCATDKGLSNALRTTYCDLLIQCYIEASSQEYVSVGNYTKVWDEITNKPQRTVDIPERFLRLKEFVFSYLKGASIQRSEDIDVNRLTLSVTKVLGKLCNFGFVCYRLDKNEVVGSLLHTLDTRQESPSNPTLTKMESNCDERLVRSKAAEVVMECKWHICSILQFFFDQRLDQRLEKLLYMYKQALEHEVHQSSKEVPSNALIPSVSDETLRRRKHVFLRRYRKRLNRLPARKNSIQAGGMLEYTKKATKRSKEIDHNDFDSLFDDDTIDGFVEGLGDTEGDNDDNDYDDNDDKDDDDDHDGRNATGSLLSKAKTLSGSNLSGGSDSDASTRSSSSKGGDKSRVDAYMVDVLRDQLRYESPKLTKMALSLLFRHFRQRSELHLALGHVQLVVSEAMVETHREVSQRLNQLRRLTSSLLLEKQELLVANILTYFADLCVCNADRSRATVAQNQLILKNFEAHKDILQILQMPYSNTPEEAGLRSVFKCCYRALKHFCQGNRGNQMLLFQYVDLMMSQMGIGLKAAATINEVFRDNWTLCSQVTERHVRHFVNLITLCGRNARYLSFLSTLVAVNGVAQTQNQNLVLKLLLEKAKETMVLFIERDGINDLRKHAQTEDALADTEGILQYHVALVNLLAKCTMGKNRFTESKCQSLITMGDALNVITAPDIPWVVRSPWIAFFHEVYLLTEVTTALVTEFSAVWTMLRVFYTMLCRDASIRSQGSQVANSDIISLGATFDDDDFYIPRDQSYLTVVLPVIGVFFTKHFSFKKSSGSQTMLSNRLLDALVMLIPYAANHYDEIRHCVAVMQRAGLQGNDRMAVNRVTNPPTEDTDTLVMEEMIADGLVPFAGKLREFVRFKDEFTSLVNCFQRNLFTSVVTHECLRKIIDHLIQTGDRTREDVARDMICLRILRAILEAERDTGQSERLTKAQNILAELGGARMFVMLVSSKNERLVFQALKFGVVLLHGGNLYAQTSIYEYFMSTRVERFFADISAFLSHSIDEMKERKRSSKIGRAAKRTSLRSRTNTEGSGDLPPTVAVVNTTTTTLTTPSRLSRLQTSGTLREQMAMLGTTTTNLHDIMKANQHLRTPKGGGSSTAPTAQASTPVVAGTIKKTHEDGSITTTARGLLPKGTSFLLGPRDTPTSKVAAFTDSSSPSSDSSACIKEVLRMLQLLCEGHNNCLQNYLRHQTDNLKSFDLVSETVQYLFALVHQIGPSNIELAIQLFDTLTEYVQGPCRENQSVIVSQICEPVNRILRTEFSQCESSDVDRLKSSAVQTLLGLLEGIQSSYVPKLMLENLDFTIMKRNLDTSWKRAHAKSCDELTRSEALNAAFMYFILVSVLSEYETEPEGAAHTVMSTCKGREFLEAKTGRIEILRDKMLERVYFRIPDVCDHLSKKSKAELLWNADRESPTSKIRDFFDAAEYIVFEIEHNHRISQHPFISWFTKNDLRWQDTSFTLALCINVLIVLFWTSKDPTMTYDHDYFLFPYLVSFLSLIHVACSFCMVAVFLIKWGPLMAYRKHRVENPKDRKSFMLLHKSSDEPDPDVDTSFMSDSTDNDNDGHSNISSSSSSSSSSSGSSNNSSSSSSNSNNNSSSSSSTRGSGSGGRNDDDVSEVVRGGEEGRSVLSAWLPNIMTSSKSHPTYRLGTLARFLAFDPLTLYHVVFLITSLAGVFISPFFFAFHLLDIARRRVLLRNVIQAVTGNGRSILLTGLLVLIIIYIYSIFGFLFFPHTYGQDGEDEFPCHTMYQCLVTTLNYGIRSGGGIGDILSPVRWNDPQMPFRVFFDISFFIVVITILLNVIFGIIIDTFGELRAKKQSIEEDTNTRCFICSMEASEFDRNADGFEHHVKLEHNMWWYIYFFVYLLNKDGSDHTGQESYVKNMIDNQDLSFFPINKAICFHQPVDEKEDALQALREQVEDLQDEMRTRDQRVISLLEQKEGGDGNMSRLRRVAGSMTRLAPVLRVMSRDNSKSFRSRATSSAGEIVRPRSGSANPPTASPPLDNRSASLSQIARKRGASNITGSALPKGGGLRMAGAAQALMRNRSKDGL